LLGTVFYESTLKMPSPKTLRVINNKRKREEEMDGKETILIVDVDESVCKSLELVFQKNGYETETAGTGGKAVEKAQDRFFNLVLLDINLPDMEGAEAVARLKGMHPDAAVIMTKAHASFGKAARALNKGASACITKPLNMDEVLTLAGEFLEKQRLIFENRRLCKEAEWEIARRKQAEEALRKSESRYSTLFDSASDAIFIHNLKLRCLDVNRTACERLGYSREELLKMTVIDIVSPYYGRLVPERIKKLRQQGHILFETAHVRQDGTVIPIEASTRLVEYGGKPAILTIARDISERKRALDMLRTEHDKLQGVLNAMGEGIYIVNRDFIIEYQNKVLKELLGDSTGRKCYAIFMQSNEPCEFCRLHEAITSGKIKHVETIRPDGRNYEIIFSPFTDVDGNVKVIILLRDITEKKRLEADAIRVSHLASLGELAAGVAHEINNPINGIINYAEILKDQCLERGEDAAIPIRINKEGERIAEIVNGLLSFARDRKEEYSFVLVKDILSDTFGLAGRQLNKDGIKFSMDVPSGLPKIKARSQQIQQVFLNILSNARYALNKRFPEHHEDKILAIKVKMIETEGGNYVRTTFYDGGTGISAQILDKICNPFFSTKPRGEGTGLGLSISHGIVKNHGGRLRFESVEGEYTKVIADLPEGKEWESNEFMD
jgi:PAS domain S-box-containing protein